MPSSVTSLCRPAGKGGELRFNERRFAIEYDRRMTAEGYPGTLLEEIISEIGSKSTVIDAGAGAGHFALPLAQSGRLVTAVEPSPFMCLLLSEKSEHAKGGKITICQSTWEAWSGEGHEALICVHSLYGMGDIFTALGKMRRSAERSVVIVRSDGESRTLSEIIRRELGRGRCSAGFADPVAKALGELALPFTRREVRQTRTSRFERIGEEADFYAYHLGMGTEFTKQVCSILEKNTVFDGHTYAFQSEYRDTVFAF